MRGCGCHDTSLERETGIRPRTVDAVFCRCHLALPCHESVAACICLEDSKATTLAALAEVVDGKPGCRSFRSSPARRVKKKEASVHSITLVIIWRPFRDGGDGQKRFAITIAASQGLLTVLEPWRVCAAASRVAFACIHEPRSCAPANMTVPTMPTKTSC